MKTAKQNGLTNLLSLGGVDVFVTHTFSSKDEDLRAVANGRASHHMDVETTRIAKLKFQRLQQEIKAGYFGPCKAMSATDDWQGRDLPHCHTTAGIDQTEAANQLTVEKMAAASVAKMPDPAADLELAWVIFKTNMHRCMDRCNTPYGCKYNFPFPYRYGLDFAEGGLYPQVERPPPSGDVVVDRANVHFVSPDDTIDSYTYSKYENGAIVLHLSTGDVDCRNVVKYCPDLSRRYRCHINMEFLNQTGACLSYLFKYITKGNDTMTGAVTNEAGHKVQTLEGMFLNANQAVHRLLGMELVHQFPPVTVLPVHLEGQAQVVLEEGMDAEQVEALLDGLKPSKLEAYFKFHQSSFPLAPQSEPRPGGAVPYEGEVRCPCSQPDIALRLQSPTYASFGANMRWNGAKHSWHPYQQANRSIARVLGTCLANRFDPFCPIRSCVCFVCSHVQRGGKGALCAACLAGSRPGTPVLRRLACGSGRRRRGLCHLSRGGGSAWSP